MIASKLGRDPFRFGHSIQGGKVYTNAGELWHEFETHAEAQAALAAFKVGHAEGMKDGEEKAKAEIRTVLGFDGRTEFVNPRVIR